MRFLVLLLLTGCVTPTIPKRIIPKSKLQSLRERALCQGNCCEVPQAQGYKLCCYDENGVEDCKTTKLWNKETQ